MESLSAKEKRVLVYESSSLYESFKKQSDALSNDSISLILDLEVENQPEIESFSKEVKTIYREVIVIDSGVSKKQEAQTLLQNLISHFNLTIEVNNEEFKFVSISEIAKESVANEILSWTLHFIKKMPLLNQQRAEHVWIKQVVGMLGNEKILFLNYDQQSQGLFAQKIQAGMKVSKTKKLTQAHLKHIEEGGKVEDKKDLGFIDYQTLDSIEQTYDIIIDRVTESAKICDFLTKIKANLNQRQESQQLIQTYKQIQNLFKSIFLYKTFKILFKTLISLYNME